eukprot:1187615-Prorocentrum_minimum.AAC.7
MGRNSNENSREDCACNASHRSCARRLFLTSCLIHILHIPDAMYPQVDSLLLPNPFSRPDAVLSLQVYGGEGGVFFPVSSLYGSWVKLAARIWDDQCAFRMPFCQTSSRTHRTLRNAAVDTRITYYLCSKISTRFEELLTELARH